MNIKSARVSFFATVVFCILGFVGFIVETQLLMLIFQMGITVGLTAGEGLKRNEELGLEMRCLFDDFKEKPLEVVERICDFIRRNPGDFVEFVD